MTVRFSRKEKKRRQKRLTARHSHEMTVYHFTNLLSFDSILEEGLRDGEVPIEGPAFANRPNAPNVTTNPSPSHQHCWCRGDSTDKTRFRFTLRVRQRHLTSFDSIRREYRFSRRWVDILSPNGEHKDWFFAFEGIPAKQIVRVDFDLFQDGCYATLNASESKALAQIISEEKFRVGYKRSRHGGRWISFLDDVPTFFLDYRYGLSTHLSDVANRPRTSLIDVLKKEEVFNRICNLNRCSAGKAATAGGAR